MPKAVDRIIAIDIPKDVFLAESEYTDYQEDRETEEAFKENKYRRAEIAEAVELIEKAQRPIIYAGGGVIIADAAKEFYEMVVKGNIPVVNTLMSLGSFPREHPLSLGLVGMHGLRPANLAVSNSDLVIAVGARFSDRVIGAADQFAKKAKLIQIVT